MPKNSTNKQTSYRHWKNYTWQNHYWLIWTYPIRKSMLSGEMKLKNEAQKRWQAYQAGDLKTVCYDAVMKKYK